MKEGLFIETKRGIKKRRYDRLLQGFETIEIKLRIMRLFKVCDLSVYDGRKFKSAEEIHMEAEENIKRFN